MGRFDKYAPGDILKPYIKYFVISESEYEHAYKVLPDTSLVIGLQYKGKLAQVINGKEENLSVIGVTGLQDGYRLFKGSANIGTVLVYFKETGAAAFFNQPVNELFAQSLALDHFFDRSLLREISEQLATAETDLQRIQVTELFLISQLKDVTGDILVTAAIMLIRQSKGMMRMKDLAEKLNISQSPFEKRFRRVVGASPKKFASIVRLQTVINEFPSTLSMTEIGYRIGYYDQAHFIKDFKNFTGETPEKFFQPK
jgi:AraC-like DNA-binding protein